MTEQTIGPDSTLGDVRRAISAREAAYEAAQQRHDLATNPVTRFVSGVMVWATAHDLQLSLEQAGQVIQVHALDAGLSPMAED